MKRDAFDNIIAVQLQLMSPEDINLATFCGAAYSASVQDSNPGIDVLDGYTNKMSTLACSSVHPVVTDVPCSSSWTRYATMSRWSGWQSDESSS
jgi:hypothetical protein